MKRILTTEQAIKASQQLHKEGKTVVLAGGCFDILHIGHIVFLQKAKEHGNILMVFVEHDNHIKKRKGEKRPINTQQDRAYLLAHLTPIDYVILLPEEIHNETYDALVNQIKPAIIATTAGDKNRFHKERQALLVGAKIIDVTPEIKNQSTTRVLALHEKGETKRT